MKFDITCMICNVFKEDQNENNLWDDKLNHGLPVCEGCAPLIIHLYGWNHWERHKDQIKADYYNAIMDELHPKKKENLDVFL